MADKLSPQEELELERIKARTKEMEFQKEQQTKSLYNQALNYAQQNKEEGVSLLVTAKKYLNFLETGIVE